MSNNWSYKINIDQTYGNKGTIHFYKTQKIAKVCYNIQII